MGTVTKWIEGRIANNLDTRENHFPDYGSCCHFTAYACLAWIIELIAPIMGIFGLSGEAAIPLVLGNGLNLYAGIAGILSLELTVKEVFIIAVMLSFSHNCSLNRGLR